LSLIYEHRISQLLLVNNRTQVASATMSNFRSGVSNAARMRPSKLFYAARNNLPKMPKF